MKFCFTQELKDEILKTLNSLEKTLNLNAKTNVIYTNEARLGKNFTIQRSTGFIFNGNELYGSKFIFDINPVTIDKKIYYNYMNKLIRLNDGHDTNWIKVGANIESHDLNCIFATIFTYWQLRYDLIADMEHTTVAKNYHIKHIEEDEFDFNNFFNDLDKEIINKRKENLKIIIPSLKILMNNTNPNLFKINWFSFKSTIKYMPVDEDFKMERNQNGIPLSWLLGDLTSWTDAIAEVYGYVDKN